MVKVDEEDKKFLEKGLCMANTGYVVYREDGKVVQLHRIIMGLILGDGKIVDHVKRKKLDNKRINLREVTRSQNGRNKVMTRQK